jgi:tellurite resistance protein
MYMKREAENDLRPDQVRAMAHGLYYLACLDGITEKEKELLTSFLKEGDLELDLASLDKIPFSLEELTYSLETIFLRRTFLKVAILMAQADGVVTDDELALLRRMAQAFGVTEPLDEIMADLQDKSL